MNDLTLVAQRIKDAVSAQDVAVALGWEVRHGRCKCPIHGGNDFNCRLYPGNRGYVCWVCKSAGDVISLVRNYYHGMSFPDACRWLNDEFNLGMDLDSPMSPEAVKQAKNEQKRRVYEREFNEWKEKMQFDIALTADRILEMLEEQRDANVPKTPWEPWNDKFCQAVELIPQALAFAEKCMAECIRKE